MDYWTVYLGYCKVSILVERNQSEAIFIIDEKLSILYASSLLDSDYNSESNVCEYVCPVCRSCELCFVRSVMETGEYDEMRYQSDEGVIQIKVWPVHLDIVNMNIAVVLWQNISSKEAVEAQTYHAQKLEAIGELSAGIAHEINNPIGFIYGNMKILKEYASVLRQVADIASEFCNNADSDAEELKNRYQELDQNEKIDDVIADLNLLLDENIDGAARVSDIVSNLKSFARPDLKEKVQCNINDGMITTLKVMNNELKYKCKVIEDYGDLPDIECFPGELNQVFMNLISNAVQAIKEDGVIHVTTRAEDGNIVIKIKDNGCGIPPENVNHIFDPFFSTKPVGKGTGLGLSVSHGIIEKHHGEINVSSTPGEGTVFTIVLPITVESNEVEKEKVETL